MQYNPEEFEEILNLFKAESDEIIQKFNDRFMELEKNPDDKTPLKELFQLAHSLKGGARMIGFNSIQDIAHKLEDILSYWKNDNAEINPEFFTVIYKVCDFLSELAAKSVKLKSDCKDENTKIFLNKLDDFISHNAAEHLKEEALYETEHKLNTIEAKAVDINAALLELMFAAEKDYKENCFDDIKEVLGSNLEQLSEIFMYENYPDVYDKISSLKNFIFSENRPENIFEDVKTGIKELKNIIYNIYKNLNISTAEKNIRKSETEKQQGNADKQEISSIIDDDFNFAVSNLPKLKSDNSAAAEIKTRLKNIIQASADNRISVILEKIVNIIDKYEKKGGIIDGNCYMAVLQGIFLAKRLSMKDKNDYENSITSIMQRLNVIEDMFNTQTSLKAEEMPAASAASDLAQNTMTGLTAAANADDMFKSVNLQEIKTLRVDTAKLDSLIMQTGELLINGIKTREHIIELAAINNKLIKWNSAGKKILNYLKYLEKKGFFTSGSDDSAGVFYRRTQNFFLHNSELIAEISSDFSNLYNIISEDDNKLYQTAAAAASIAKGIRVLPLAALFHSFPRMVRDIAKENNKKINFIISGSDTAVDKKIIEEIKMPLIHILRNAVYHGIERPEDRIKNGKKETGTLRLTSRQEDNSVIITIEDDGYGADIEKVKEKALEKGLLTAEEISRMDSKDLLKILFLPGFSTAESVNEISGRGIGLDIVKTKITNLNGEIMIDSVLNRGCRVSIRLPLSMSTIKTFILAAGGRKYAVPINSIKSALQADKSRIFDNNGVKSIIYENHSLPVYSISEILGGEDTAGENGIYTIIIIEAGGRQTALAADKLLGDQEVFLKKLIPPIIKIKNISGFTVLPAGEICLILNPYELAKNAGAAIAER